MISKKDFKKINNYLWEIPKSFRKDMRVPARIYVDEKMLEQTLKDRSVEQLVNTAALQGVQNYTMAMPDIHEGYGFPIGGVAAMRAEDGIISPGGVGYDINCGVRLLRSDLRHKEIQPYLENLANQIQRDVPSGLGRGHLIKLDIAAIDKVLQQGARRVVEQGYGEKEDLEYSEESGEMKQADSSKVSDYSKNRGRDQVGTLGSGNHFLEVQRVEQVFDEATAESFGLFKDQITVMIHTGSRGLGHQIATDYIKIMMRAMPKYKINLPDNELACTPFNSLEGRNYFAAMSCGANFAWANRQMITYLIRRAWQKILGDKTSNLKLVYDVAHNMAKVEEHEVSSGKIEKVVVHRKGATRAFGPGRPEIPRAYRDVGQPVLIPGSMGTASYVLAGTKETMKETFGSTCHGAGRTMSRHAAIRQVRGENLKRQLEAQGIVIRGGSWRGLAEEAPIAYKNVDNVVNVVYNAGIAKKVVRLKPLAVVKG